MADSTAVQPMSADQVLALAPDLVSQRAARGLAGAGAWAETGCVDDAAGSGDAAGSDGDGGGVPATVWGLARGSGAVPYRTAVDVSSGPAYRCSCPSRKVPCKHALGLLLHWSAGHVGPAPVPGWVREWHAERAERASRAERAAARAVAAAGPRGTDTVADRDPAGPDAAGATDPAQGDGAAQGDRATASRRSGERAVTARMERVATGLDELDRWLADQVRAGIAGLASAGYDLWDAVAARLVDAKASTVAGTVRRLSAVAGSPDRLLTELALLRLLISGYRRLDDLPADLADTVRARVGLPYPAERVLAERPPVRDRWHLVAVRDEQEDHLLVRRVWLRGRHTGVPALVLGFAGPGQVLPVDLILGTELDADLCFYPGAQPLRALVATRHGAPEPGGVPAGTDIAGALRGYAAAMAGDPWLERWPVVLAGAVVPGGRRYLAEPDGTALPVDPRRPTRGGWSPAAGLPLAVAGEWSASGLRPLTAWPDGRLVRL
jgi:hypothetical protein